MYLYFCIGKKVNLCLETPHSGSCSAKSCFRASNTSWWWWWWWWLQTHPSNFALMTLMMLPYPSWQYQAADNKSRGRNHSLRMKFWCWKTVPLRCEWQLLHISYFVFVLLISKIPLTIVPTTGRDLPLGLKLPSLRCCIPTNDQQPAIGYQPTNQQPSNQWQPNQSLPTINQQTNQSPTTSHWSPTTNQPTNSTFSHFPLICIEQSAQFSLLGVSCNLTCNNFCTNVVPIVCITMHGSCLIYNDLHLTHIGHISLHCDWLFRKKRLFYARLKFTSSSSAKLMLMFFLIFQTSFFSAPPSAPPPQKKNADGE